MSKKEIKDIIKTRINEFQINVTKDGLDDLKDISKKLPDTAKINIVNDDELTEENQVAGLMNTDKKLEYSENPDNPMDGTNTYPNVAMFFEKLQGNPTLMEYLKKIDTEIEKYQFFKGIAQLVGLPIDRLSYLKNDFTKLADNQITEKKTIKKDMLMELLLEFGYSIDVPNFIEGKRYPNIGGIAHKVDQLKVVVMFEDGSIREFSRVAPNSRWSKKTIKYPTKK